MMAHYCGSGLLWRLQMMYNVTASQHNAAWIVKVRLIKKPMVYINYEKPNVRVTERILCCWDWNTSPLYGLVRWPHSGGFLSIASIALQSGLWCKWGGHYWEVSTKEASTLMHLYIHSMPSIIIIIIPYILLILIIISYWFFLNTLFCTHNDLEYIPGEYPCIGHHLQDTGLARALVPNDHHLDRVTDICAYMYVSQ